MMVTDGCPGRTRCCSPSEHRSCRRPDRRRTSSARGSSCSDCTATRRRAVRRPSADRCKGSETQPDIDRNRPIRLRPGRPNRTSGSICPILSSCSGCRSFHDWAAASSCLFWRSSMFRRMEGRCWVRVGKRGTIRVVWLDLLDQFERGSIDF